MFELRAAQQEPLCDLVAFRITRVCLLQVVNDRHGLFRLFLRTQLLVLLDHDISLLDLFLVSIDLIIRELDLSHALQQWADCLGRQPVLSEAEILEGAVCFEHVDEFGDRFAVEVVVAEVQYLEGLVLTGTVTRLQDITNLRQVTIFQT